MAADPNAFGDDGARPPWFSFATLLFAVLLTAMLFLLGKSMVQHHFFDGGQMNRRDTPR
jgi:hypothetical protein